MKTTEQQALASEAISALRKLAALDRVTGGLAIHVAEDLRGMGYEPPPKPYAGPEGAPDAGPTDPPTK